MWFNSTEKQKEGQAGWTAGVEGAPRGVGSARLAWPLPAAGADSGQREERGKAGGPRSCAGACVLGAGEVAQLAAPVLLQDWRPARPNPVGPFCYTIHENELNVG